MPYKFFFSYAQNDNDPYLVQFFDDLSEAVIRHGGIRGERRGDGLNVKPTVGFFSQKSLRLGAEWNSELVQALQTSNVMVCLYSPSYFNSENCGREWKFFDLRRDLYVENRRAAGEAHAIPPPVIIPVLWVPLRKPLPSEVRGVDFDLGDPDAPHNDLGVLKLTKQKGKFQTEYSDFVDEVAKLILDAGGTLDEKEQSTLPTLDLDKYKTFAAVPNAFEPAPDEGGCAAPPPEGTVVITEPKALGPNSVQFVFVAGSPSEFIAAKLRHRKEYNCYIENGGRDWRPFLQDLDWRIRPYVTNIATDRGLEFDVEELACDGSLERKIGEAKSRRNLVIILVDSWTLDLDRYEHILRSLHIYSNCSILIPWNEKDPDLTKEQRARLEKKVRETFDNWWCVAKPLYFCYSIHSADDLDNKIRETLTALRNAFVNEVVADESQDIQRAPQSDIQLSRLYCQPPPANT